MHKSYVIEVDGTSVGAAITDRLGYRFVAVDARLYDLEATIWSTVTEMRRDLRLALNSSTLFQPKTAKAAG